MARFSSHIPANGIYQVRLKAFTVSMGKGLLASSQTTLTQNIYQQKSTKKGKAKKYETENSTVNKNAQPNDKKYKKTMNEDVTWQANNKNQLQATKCTFRLVIFLRSSFGIWILKEFAKKEFHEMFDRMDSVRKFSIIAMNKMYTWPVMVGRLLTFLSATTSITLVTNVTKAAKAEKRAKITRTLRTCMLPT